MPSRRIRSRRAVVIALAVAVMGGGVALAVLETRSSQASHAVLTSSATTTTTATAPPTTTTSSTTTTTTIDPGALPQTMQLPASTDPQFAAEIQALWQGVVQDSVTPALPAFFPKSAYVQLKTGIGDPAGDWQNRLVADYGLDVEAAHALLGPDPTQATFVSVSVLPASAPMGSATTRSPTLAWCTSSVASPNRLALRRSSRGAASGTWCTSAPSCARAAQARSTTRKRELATPRLRQPAERAANGSPNPSLETVALLRAQETSCVVFV